MLSFSSPHDPSANGITRRQLLSAGTLGLSALSLADLFRLEAKSTSPRKGKSVIYIVLDGGPSHIDMYDLKPAAPEEYRGPFRPIRTRLPGVQICELMPLQAQRFDRVALLRGVASVENDHFLSEVYTGLPRTAGRRPAFGSAVSKLQGTGSALPSYVSLNRESTGPFEFELPHYAGPGHAPFRPFGEALKNMRPVASLDRLTERRKLLTAFDTLRRDLDQQSSFRGLDQFTARALEIVTSPAVRDAFDLSKEPDRLFERYGKGGKYTHQTVKSIVYDFDSRPFIQARRLVEAGVRVVTLRVPQWDHHSGEQSDIFHSLKLMLPPLDRAVSALLDDLRDRGLEKDVLVVMLGEFGRTPRITYPGPGREHHADAGCVLFAGGGLKMGQVIGETDSRGDRARSRSLNFQNIMTTIYHVLGIDPATQFDDFSGRPQYLLEDREPIPELDAPRPG